MPGGRVASFFRVHALMAAVLLRMPWLDARDSDAEPEPPDGELRQVEQCIRDRSLNDTEKTEDTDQLVKMLGVTASTAAELNSESIDSVQQLADQDPVSLALRTGLSFDYILNLVARSQAWCFIGETAGKLAPLGFGDARTIAKLIRSVERPNPDPVAEAALKAAAEVIKIDSAILRTNFRNIADDSYTKFLTQISSTEEKVIGAAGASNLKRSWSNAGNAAPR